MSKIIIHQSLHGYDQGHSLLESSISIKSEAKRTLMVMSDMSGTSMQNGFEEYITGYPLKDMNMYALAKTWNAPEMERPGCVWTHTLLINFSDLIYFVDCYNILRLFKRPTENNDWSLYNQPVDFFPIYNSLSFYNFSKSEIYPDLIKGIIYSLYQKYNSTILIQSPNSLIYEHLILSIWFQQWPRLKRNFSFCTGAISARILNNQFLDLQAIPFKTDRSIIDKENITIINASNLVNNPEEKWVDYLYDDLISNSVELRKFLNTYGADVREDRSAIISLVKVYIYFTNKSELNIPVIIDKLSNYFPLPNDAITLKEGILFKNQLNGSAIFPHLEEESILFELATTELYASFDYDNLKFDERFKDIFIENSKSLFTLFDKLIVSNINPRSEILFAEIAEKIDKNELLYLNKNHRKLLLIFVSINPILAYFEEFWNVGTSQQTENIYTLSKNYNTDWNNVIGILLKVDAKIDKDIICNINIPIVRIILDWINNNDRVSIGSDWVELVKEKPQDILDWLISNSYYNNQLLKFMPKILNPNSFLISTSDINVWLKIISTDNLNLEYDDKIRFKAFILALSLKKREEGILSLLSYSFEDVYNATLKDELDYDSWKVLEVNTKPLSYWQEWDKCKKLRNALVNKFIEQNWSINYLGQVSQNKELLKPFFYEYEKFKNNWR